MATTNTTSGIQLLQSTNYTRVFYFGTTGQTVAVALSKAGGGFAAATNTPAVEISAGFYKILLSATDVSILGDLAWSCTAASGGPATWTDQVVSQLFSQLSMNASGQVLIASNYKQNQPALLPFTMTVGNPAVATAGLAPVGQKNFGSGFSPIAGTITDLGFGAYVAALQASDCNAAVAYYHFTSATPNANEQDITLYFQP